MIISRVVLHQPMGLLRLQTNSGLEGNCFGIPSSSSDIEHIGDLLLDSNPLDRERIWWIMKEMNREIERHLRLGIDIALWDLSAKVAGQSLFRHVNGFRHQIPVCLVGSISVEGQDILQEAREAQKKGFKAFRFESSLPEEDLINLIRELRIAVGSDFPLIFDGRNDYIPDQAIRIGKVLDEEDFFCFEYPRPNNDHLSGKHIACEIDTPTSMGISTPMETAQVLSLQSADHVRTSVEISGGFTDVVKSIRCAEAFGAYCLLEGSGICDGFVHLHLLGSSRNCPFMEMSNSIFKSPYIKNPLEIREGLINIPDMPGLGMQLDLNSVKEQTVELIKI